jgi:Sulfotransferase family
MLNKAPIFVNALWRGGSNILVNLLLSHPDVCSATGELQRVFRGGARGERLSRVVYKYLRYGLPVDLVAGLGFFRPDNLEPRSAPPASIRRHIDRVLYREKLRARHEQHNLFVREGVVYSSEQIASSRLLCKNLNGLVFLTDLFSSMYPDATFFGLLRNGFALCDGFVRRGLSPETCARIYVRVVEKMLEDVDRLKRYHVVRFDEILRDPPSAIRRLYRSADLDDSKVERIRLQHKPTLDRTGAHQLRVGRDREVVWYDWDKLSLHLRADIDELQAAHLDSANRERFLTIAGPVMERVGYL